MNELIDRFGRLHQSLRISVTDRCNIRCFYCMPTDEPTFMAAERWLSFDHIVRLVGLFVSLGVRKLRITGGEPLMRPQLSELIARLSQIPSVDDLALTTNGMLLANQAASLHAAGLRRINISLDTLNEATFMRISRRTGLNRVLEGIDAAQQAALKRFA